VVAVGPLRGPSCFKDGNSLITFCLFFAAQRRLPHLSSHSLTYI
jgi:hypothetical protein